MKSAFSKNSATPQEQSSHSGFFQQKPGTPFFEGNKIQRLASPKDEQEPPTNDGRMKLDKDIQRCPCEDKKR
jgi:hypothetical protein